MNHQKKIWQFYTNEEQLSQSRKIAEDTEFFRDYLTEKRFHKFMKLTDTPDPIGHPVPLPTLLFAWKGCIESHLELHGQKTLDQMASKPELDKFFDSEDFGDDCSRIAWLLAFVALRVLWGRWPDKKISYYVLKA